MSQSVLGSGVGSFMVEGMREEGVLFFCFFVFVLIIVGSSRRSVVARQKLEIRGKNASLIYFFHV